MSKRVHGKAISHKGPQGQVSTAVSLSLTEDFLPPPDDMVKYEALNPGITKVLTMAFVDQMTHRQHLERTVIEGDNRRADRAQWLSFFLALAFGGMGVYLVMNGIDILGYISLIGAITALVGAFFGGAFLRFKERREKDKPAHNRE